MKSLLIAATTIATAFAEPVPMTFTATDRTEVLYRFAAPEKAEAGKYPIARKRIYLTGLSMGSFGTWDMLARSPQTWAAAMPICGGGAPQTVGKFKDVAIRIFHGELDEVVPTKSSELMAEALRKAGSKAELTMYPGVGHDSWTPTYQDREVIKWLFAQRKPD